MKKLYILIAICIITSNIHIKAQESDSLFFQNKLWEYDNKNDELIIHITEQFYFADDGRFYNVNIASASGYYKHFYSGRYEYNVAYNTILLYAEKAYDCFVMSRPIPVEYFYKSLIIEDKEGKKILSHNHLITEYPPAEFEQQQGDSFFVMEGNKIFEVDFIKIDDSIVSKEDQKTILTILRRAQPRTDEYIKGYRKEYATIFIKDKDDDLGIRQQIRIFTCEIQDFIWHENDFEELINITDKYKK